jgi:hypothetical protein
MRRLVAVAGGAGPGGPTTLRIDDDYADAYAQNSPETPVAEALSADMVGEPVLIYEYNEPFRADDGQLYVVRAFGQSRADGTWIGWLAFVGADGQTVRRTPRETTQSNRAHLEYWATGLQPSYLEGSFARSS